VVGGKEREEEGMFKEPSLWKSASIPHILLDGWHAEGGRKNFTILTVHSS
jgi:hypothetical protein